ncbi:alginate O-acetyltransferase AlgX-related protein [Xanthobacteraceae bacterium A53D]
MGMLVHHRRYMGIVFVVMVGCLLLGNLVPDPLGRGEWRGPDPEKATSLTQRLSAHFRRLTFYFGDNFGFRATLPVLRRDVREAADSPHDKNVYRGRNGNYFWAGERTPEQSTGLLVRPDAVERFVQVAAILQREVAPFGAKVVVAVPPNAQSVELEAQPYYTPGVGHRRVTEYDLMLAGMKREGVTAVDLRKVLRESDLSGSRYRAADSHWDNRATVVAFNATMAAAGHPDWHVDLKEAIGPTFRPSVSDLLVQKRVPREVVDLNYTLIFRSEPARSTNPAFKPIHEAPNFLPYVIKYKDEGPRVLVMGDSFTIRNWPLLFSYTPVAEAAWIGFSRMTYGHCNFDADEVKAYKPDVIIIARTERYFPCLNTWPQNLPKP